MIWGRQDGLGFLSSTLSCPLHPQSHCFISTTRVFPPGCLSSSLPVTFLAHAVLPSSHSQMSVVAVPLQPFLRDLILPLMPLLLMNLHVHVWCYHSS